jgi:hypothetical protein
MDQLEWGDYWIRQNLGSKILNPPGFYIYLIKANIRPPELFETSRKKAIFSNQKQAREKELEKQAALEFAMKITGIRYWKAILQKIILEKNTRR